MQICVNKALLGTRYHLTYDGDVYCWTDTVPDDSWLWGWGEEKLKSLEPVYNLLHPDLKFIDDEPTWSMWRSIGSPKNMMWSHALPVSYTHLRAHET